MSYTRNLVSLAVKSTSQAPPQSAEDGQDDSMNENLNEDDEFMECDADEETDDPEKCRYKMKSEDGEMEIYGNLVEFNKIKTKIKSHRQRQLKQTLESVPNVEKFCCSECPTTSSKLTLIVKHEKRHEKKVSKLGTKLQFCSLCTYSSPNSINLKWHMRFHMPEYMEKYNAIHDGSLLPPPFVSNFLNGDGGCSYSVSSDLSKGGFDLDMDEEVSIVGNENDFEIENDIGDDGEILSDSEIIDLKEPTIDYIKKFGNDLIKVSNFSSRSKYFQLSLTPIVRLEKLNVPAKKKQNEFRNATQQQISEVEYRLYSVKDEVAKTDSANKNKYLLKSMRIVNFMCFEDVSFDLNLEAVLFSGCDGKSSSIIAFLLGIGYDVLLENHTPKTLCGWEISDLIRRGTECAKIEIQLSLSPSSEFLYSKYGPILKIERTFKRGLPLSLCPFEISPKLTPSPLSTNGVTKGGVGLGLLREIHRELNMSSLYFRLILLDRQNLKALSNDINSWYDYFIDGVASKSKNLESKVGSLSKTFLRLQNDLKWRRERQQYLRNQLAMDYPYEDDPVFSSWKVNDIKILKEVDKDLKILEGKLRELEKVVSPFDDKLKNIREQVLEDMNEIYSQFLATQKCTGSIIVDNESKKLRIWLREISATAQPNPSNVDEAEIIWSKSPQARRQLAIFGLYLGLWKVIDTCPFFAVDSYSKNELEFKFPTKGLPVLHELAMSKTSQQFLMTYPDQ